MDRQEEQEALESIVTHYGLPVLLNRVNNIVARIKAEVMSVPLPPDPERASLKLYETRMRGEGAQSVINALEREINQIKSEMLKGRNQ